MDKLSLLTASASKASLHSQVGYKGSMFCRNQLQHGFCCTRASWGIPASANMMRCARRLPSKADVARDRLPTLREVLNVGEQPALVLLGRPQHQRGCHVGLQVRPVSVRAVHALPSQRQQRQLAAALTCYRLRLALYSLQVTCNP